MRALLLSTTALIFLCTPALAQETMPMPERKPLEGRVEGNFRGGSDRSIAMTEFWVPFTQDVENGDVFYGDLRFMGDDQDNREFNLGVGYRSIETNLPVLGDGVAGVHGWFDRRLTERGSAFHQITAGAEWLGDIWDVRGNVYMPLSGDETHAGPTINSNPFLAGTGIFYDSSKTLITEEAQKGLDLEIGWKVPFADDFTDSTRIYAGVYHFEGDKSENVSGWRTRITSDITSDFQIGGRFQRDDERGSQGFLEATIRFPFGNKKSYKSEGLYARLDESPERDIDIVTGAKKESLPSVREAVVSTQTGTVQRVIHVDNTAAGGGDGSLENPYATLADAQAILADSDVVYVNRGDGTTTGMDQGFNVDKAGVQFIGSGVNFVYDGSKFTTQDGNNFTGTILKNAGLAPVITNINPLGSGIYVTAGKTSVGGITVDGATTNGVYVEADGITLEDITVHNLTSNNNATGVSFRALNGGYIGTANAYNLTTLNNTASSGLTFTADANGTIDTARAVNIISNGNFHYGINFFAGTGVSGMGFINNAEVDGLQASANRYAGLFFRTRETGSRLDNAVGRNIISNNNVTTNGRGIFVETGVRSSIGTIALENTVTNGNVSEGIRVSHLGADATFDSITITNAVANGNSGVSGHGIYISSTSGAVLSDASITGASVTGNNRQGIYFRADTTSSLTGSVQDSYTSANNEHGIAVYDDTSGTFEIDLGGGGRSSGNNYLAGNTLEDLAIDYDGRTLSAQNNWWGLSGGVYQSAPSGGLKPQIYYGAPINNGLVGHWTFDTEWMDGTTAYDRSGNGYNATLYGGINASSIYDGGKRQALSFDGVDDYMLVNNFNLTGTNAVTVLYNRYKTAHNNGVEIELSSNYNVETGGFVTLSSDSTSCPARLYGGVRGNVGANIECYTRAPLSQWNEYAFVFNKGAAAASEVAVNINGTAGSFLSQPAASNNTNSFGNLPLYMMRRGSNGSLFSSESLDDVRIYSRALTAAEISELYRMDTTSVVDVSGHRTTAP